MKLGIIVNNYGKMHDGIGGYSKEISGHFSDNTQYDIFTAESNVNDIKLSRFITFGMTTKMFQASKKIGRYDAILIEYPFVEWNPLILLAFSYLLYKAKRNNTKIIISLHEYQRVHNLRKAVIRFMVRRADMVLVSSVEMEEDIKKYSNNVRIREIPSNIYGEVNNKKRKAREKYVFFGLVNKAKAYNEMLEAWDEFNKNKENELYIISSSELGKIEENHNGIRYLHSVDSERVFEIMSECHFCILPIKPVVDSKNATFKAAAIAGCACIGCFSREFADLDFLIHMKDYSDKSFRNALNESAMLDNLKLAKMNESAAKYGEKYHPNNISKVVEGIILEEVTQ